MILELQVASINVLSVKKNSKNFDYKVEKMFLFVLCNQQLTSSICCNRKLRKPTSIDI